MVQGGGDVDQTARERRGYIRGEKEEKGGERSCRNISGLQSTFYMMLHTIRNDTAC